MGVVVRPGLVGKVIMAILISSLLFPCFSATTNHSVGGPDGWDLASDLPAWAAATTFHTGDNLVFRYEQIHDVLEVNATDFAGCHTINPIKAYRDGETVIPLEKGGTTRYFFCGRSDHCARGLKLQVRVDVPPLSSPPPQQPTSRRRRPPHRNRPSRPPHRDQPSLPFPPRQDDHHEHLGPSSGGVSLAKLGISWNNAAKFFLCCYCSSTVIVFILLNS